MRMIFGFFVRIYTKFQRLRRHFAKGASLIAEWFKALPMTAHCLPSLSGFESGLRPVGKSNDLGLGGGFPAVSLFPSPLTTG